MATEAKPVGALDLPRRAAVLALVALSIPCARAAVADPIHRLPVAGAGEVEGARGRASLLLELSALAVLGAARDATLPELGDLEGGEPELARLRVGVLAESGCRPWAGLVRLDLSEALRLGRAELGERPLAASSALIDDAMALWRPRRWFELALGRQKVPLSRFRQVERALLSAPAVPLAVDRVAPDRRWGAAARGDLGALGYALGLYADGDEVEVLGDPADPSAAGQAAAALQVAWTPRAPLGEGHRATPRSDPWWDTWRLSLGAGALYRARDGADRVDLSLSAQSAWRRLGGVAELIASVEHGRLAAVGAGELSLAIGERFATAARAELDGPLDLWSIGGSLDYFATPDRRNKVSLHAWLRESRGGDELEGHGAVVQLQASL